MTERELNFIPGKLRIGIDIDWVIANLHKEEQSRFLGRFGVDIDEVSRKNPERLAEYDFRNWPELNQREGGIMFINQMYQDPSLYLEAEPINEAIDYIRKLHEQGHEIWFITGRTDKPEVKDVTISWLRRGGLDWVDDTHVYFNPQPTEKDLGHGFKPEIIRRLNLHTYIDDSGKTIDSIVPPEDELTEIMVKFLIDYSHNQTQGISNQTVRVKNNQEGWQRIFDILQDASSWLYFLTMSHNVGSLG